MNKTLYLVRGLPGSGKTTLAETLATPLGAPVFSADNFFEKKKEDGTIEYNFDISKIGIAHSVCRSKTKNAMEFEYRNIFVANTFTTEKEMREYFNLAKEFGYKIFTLVVENRHGNSNVHNVPTETLEKMKNRFNVKL